MMLDVQDILHPLVFPLSVRLLGVLGVGLLLIIVLNSGKVRGIWYTEVGKRYIGWLTIIPLYLAAVLFNGVVGFALLLLLMVQLAREYVRCVRLHQAYLGLFTGIALITLFAAVYAPVYVPMLPLGYFALIAVIAVFENDGERSFGHATSALFFTIWVIYGLSHLILLDALPPHDATNALLLMLGFAVPLSDIGAYVIGKCMRHWGVLQIPIAYNISREKTFGGVIGNVLGAGLGIWIMHFAFTAEFLLYELFLMACVIGCAASLGDLLASMFKRSGGVKDSGDAIIGHGGYFDRADSLIVATVATYYLILWLQ